MGQKSKRYIGEMSIVIKGRKQDSFETIMYVDYP
jgi:hypothetical protein